MLDYGNHSVDVTPSVRESIPRVMLPESWDDFYSQRGPMPKVFDDRRRFPRYFYRGLGVLQVRGENFEVVTKDLSRGGIGFFHYEQLFPLQEAKIWLPGEGFSNIRIVRCRRIESLCFECGALFVLETDRDAASRQIAEALRP